MAPQPQPSVKFCPQCKGPLTNIRNAKGDNPPSSHAYTCGVCKNAKGTNQEFEINLTP